MLIVLPIALFATALLFDVVYLLTNEGAFATLAFWIVVPFIISWLLRTPDSAYAPNPLPYILAIVRGGACARHRLARRRGGLSVARRRRCGRQSGRVELGQTGRADGGAGPRP
jgi:hypothetical protein